MLLQAEQSAELQRAVAVGEAGKVVGAFLQQADELAGVNMLKRINALRQVSRWCGCDVVRFHKYKLSQPLRNARKRV